jgi:hypothetical protein
MGHYDNCYEDEKLAQYRKHYNEVKKELQNFIDEHGVEDLEFLLEVAENLDDWKGFVSTISRMKKDKI